MKFEWNPIRLVKRLIQQRKYKKTIRSQTKKSKRKRSLYLRLKID